MATPKLIASVICRTKQLIRVVPASHLSSTACCKIISHVRQFSTTCTKQANENKLSTNLWQSTGMERFEIESGIAGRDEIYAMDPYVRGTKKDPIVVPSMYYERIIGCTCSKDSNVIFWINVKNDKLTRCPNCGNCFSLSHMPSDLPAEDGG